MRYVLSTVIMDNQHPSTKVKVQRPSRKGVHYKRLIVEVVKVFIDKTIKIKIWSVLV
nr:MAG TPA: hypothetical protein [Caudoviricetes sp.]